MALNVSSLPPLQPPTSNLQIHPHQNNLNFDTHHTKMSLKKITQSGCPRRDAHPKAHPYSSTTSCVYCDPEDGLIGNSNMSTSYEYENVGELCYFCKEQDRNLALQTDLRMKNDEQAAQLHDLLQQLRKLWHEQSTQHEKMDALLQQVHDLEKMRRKEREEKDEIGPKRVMDAYGKCSTYWSWGCILTAVVSVWLGFFFGLVAAILVAAFCGSWMVQELAEKEGSTGGFSKK